MKWQAQIPQPPRQRDRKRCYIVWNRLTASIHRNSLRIGGKVVWLTDKQLTLAHIKYPNKDFEEVLERDSLEEYKKYLDQTID